MVVMFVVVVVMRLFLLSIDTWDKIYPDPPNLYLAQLGWQRSTFLYTYRSNRCCSIPNWLPTSTLDRVLNYLKPFTESFFELNFDWIISVYEN